MGDKVYVATTVGDECILGAEMAEDAGEEALTGAYKVFKDECQCLKPDYSPDTVNIDGWKSTHNAWSFLFPAVVIICCFLHVFIKIRDRGKKKYKDLFLQVASKLWECYRAVNKASFTQRVRRLLEWCDKNEVPDVFLKPIEKLRENICAYMDRNLFSAQYFHGSLDAAKLGIRGWALIQNFAPSNPRTVRKHNGYQSPAERLNGFRYNDSWLQNLMISASLGGYRGSLQNPL